MKLIKDLNDAYYKRHCQILRKKYYFAVRGKDMSKMNHSEIIKDLKEKYFNTNNIEIIRIENIFSVGMPDLLVLSFPGKVSFIEIKQSIDVLRPTQRFWIEKALKLKQTCYILTYSWDKKYIYKLYKPSGFKKVAWGLPIWENSKNTVSDLQKLFLE